MNGMFHTREMVSAAESRLKPRSLVIGVRILSVSGSSVGTGDQRTGCGDGDAL